MAFEWAKPGTKCICIHPADDLKKDVVYTVRQLGDGFGPDMLSLIELNYYHSWFAWRFRPLVTKTQEQDVEMFLRLASPSPLERLDLLAERLDEIYNTDAG